MFEKSYKASQYKVIGHTHEFAYDQLPDKMRAVSMTQGCCRRFLVFGSIYAFVSFIDFSFFEMKDHIRIKSDGQNTHVSRLAASLIDDMNLNLDQICLHARCAIELRESSNTKFLYDISLTEIG